VGIHVRGEKHAAASRVQGDIAQVERILAVCQENLLEGRSSVNRPPNIGAPSKEEVLRDHMTEKRNKLNEQRSHQKSNPRNANAVVVDRAAENGANAKTARVTPIQGSVVRVEPGEQRG